MWRGFSVHPDLTMKSHNAIDFFATVGRKRDCLKCTTFPLPVYEDDPPLSPQEAWDEAITDLMLIGNGTTFFFVSDDFL